MNLTNSLLRAYLASRYCVSLGNDEQIIAIGGPTRTIDRYLPPNRAWYYITSDNPQSHQLSAAENQQRRVQLLQDIRNHALRHWPGRAEAVTGDWPLEYGYLISGAKAADLIRLLREKYSQLAAVTGMPGEAAKLILLVPLDKTVQTELKNKSYIVQFYPP